MKTSWKRGVIVVLLLLAVLLPSFSQEEGETATPGPDFGLDIGIGAEVFNEEIGGEIVPVNWQEITIAPDLAIGKFGIGLDLDFHFRFTGGDDGATPEFRTADWVPETWADVLPLYLPKFQYIRWGFKGDPLYIKLGSINDALLGNGFIMGYYSNTLFQPDQRFFGMAFDLDGELFNFPYIGLETFAGNLAVFDVFGTRLYTRPLAFLDVPIIKNLQIGGTFAMDRDPYYLLDDHDYDDDGIRDEGFVMIFGADFIQPIFSHSAFSLALFGDIVFQRSNTGGMLGLGGRFFNVVPYRFELRLLGDNFVPVYFDATYDRFRPLKYQIYSGQTTSPGYTGWLASTGVSLFEDRLVLNISVDGPFKAYPSPATTNINDYPHIRGVLTIAEGLIPGVFMSASYDKFLLRQFFRDMIDPEGAVIGAEIGVTTGPASISLVYSLRYIDDPALPADERWEKSAGIKSSLSFF
jgi:hypothetical protein